MIHTISAIISHVHCSQGLVQNWFIYHLSETYYIERQENQYCVDTLESVLQHKFTKNKFTHGSLTTMCCPRVVGEASRIQKEIERAPSPGISVYGSMGKKSMSQRWNQAQQMQVAECSFKEPQRIPSIKTPHHSREPPAQKSSRKPGNNQQSRHITKMIPLCQMVQYYC